MELAVRLSAEEAEMLKFMIEHFCDCDLCELEKDDINTIHSILVKFGFKDSYVEWFKSTWMEET